MRQAGQESGLGEGQFRRGSAEPGEGRGLDASEVAAIRGEVEVRFEDVVFGAQAFQLDRAEGFGDLGAEGAWPVVHHAADLHGDRARAGLDAAGGDVLADGADDGERIDAGVGVEAFILRGDGSFDEPGGHLAEGDGESPLFIFGDQGQQHAVGAVGDARADRPFVEALDRERKGNPVDGEGNKGEGREDGGPSCYPSRPAFPVGPAFQPVFVSTDRAGPRIPFG